MPTLKEQKEGTTFTGRGAVREGCEHRLTEANRERGQSTISKGQRAKEDEV